MNTIEIICTVIGAVGVILSGVWFIISRATKQGIGEYRLSNAEEKLSSLPCVDHGASLNTHTRSLEELSSTLEENKNMLVELSKWAMKLDGEMIDRLARKSSPLNMTEAGVYLFAKSGAEKALAKMSDRLMGLMDESELRTGYDIEQKALEILLRNTGDKAFDEVKNFIYNSSDTMIVEGTGESIKFNLYAIIKLMSIKLRDMYIERWKAGKNG